MDVNFTKKKWVREKELLKKLPFSKSTLHRKVRNGTFPASDKLSERISAWEESNLEVWWEQIRSKSSSK